MNYKWRPSVSFCIITNGAKPDHLLREIDCIQALNIPDFEIIISGRPPSLFPSSLQSQAKLIENFSAADNGRLGAMRNDCCKIATKEVLVVCDDDLIFDLNFYEGICKYGADFDLLPCRFLNTDGTRFWDWPVYGGPIGQRLIPYDANSPDIYMTGGLCILKPYVFKAVQWDDVRGFYQEEDIDFTSRVKAAGFRISFNSTSVVVHDDDKYTQVDDIVIRGIYPFTWLEISKGVIGRGVYGLENGFRWISQTAEFRFSATKTPVEISFEISAFPVMSEYLNGQLSILFRSNEIELGSTTILRSEDKLSVSLTLESGATNLEIICNSAVAPVCIESPNDFRLIGAKLENLKFNGVDPNQKPIATSIAKLKSERTLIFASALDDGELARAIREQLFSLEMTDQFALGILRNDAVLAKNLPREQREILKSLTPKIESFTSSITIHDGSFVLGTNLYRARVDRWTNSIFLGPASGINEEILAEVLSGFMYLGTFSKQDYDLLLSLGISEKHLYFTPLLPPVKSRVFLDKLKAETSRIFIPLIDLEKVNLEITFETLAKIISKNSSLVFNFWIPKGSDADAFQKLWKKIVSETTPLPEKHFNLFVGVIPDQTLEKILSHMTVAIFFDDYDPYAYLIRECLVRELPVIGLEIGARKDIPLGCGFYPAKSFTDFPAAFKEIFSSLKSWEKQALDFRVWLGMETSTRDLIRQLVKNVETN